VPTLLPVQRQRLLHMAITMMRHTQTSSKASIGYGCDRCEQLLY
jgi:hypothetical protein